MNITFIVMGHGLEKSAAIESALKNLGVPYEAKLAHNRANGKSSHTKVRVTKDVVMAVVANSNAHPRMSKVAIAKMSGVSSATVSRILDGTHSLSPKKK